VSLWNILRNGLILHWNPSMPRVLPALLASCLVVSLSLSVASAQSAPPKPQKPRSPGEMAAIDLDKNEKRAHCAALAKEQKLHLIKRRNFIRDCMNPH
jgi:sigma54-dependent transcription regulator